VFEQDQHERREVLFQARHCRHCHVSDPAIPGYNERRAIAAPHDQQTVSSASFETAQCGHSQLGPRMRGYFRARRRQSTQAKTTPPTRRRRRAPGSRSSTKDVVLGAR